MLFLGMLNGYSLIDPAHISNKCALGNSISHQLCQQYMVWAEMAQYILKLALGRYHGVAGRVRRLFLRLFGEEGGEGLV